VRKKHDDAACGEIKTAHPGYLGSQEIFYVDTFKRPGIVILQATRAAYVVHSHGPRNRVLWPC